MHFHVTLQPFSPHRLVHRAKGKGLLLTRPLPQPVKGLYRELPHVARGAHKELGQCLSVCKTSVQMASENSSKKLRGSSG